MSAMQEYRSTVAPFLVARIAGQAIPHLQIFIVRYLVPVMALIRESFIDIP